MGTSDYIAKRDLHRAYLDSPKWKKFRLEILKDRGCVCERCGSYGTDIHHKTYKRWGNEKPQDVEVLCRACHKVHHIMTRSQSKRGKRVKKLTGRGVLAYYPESLLQKAADKSTLSLRDFKTKILCYDRHYIKILESVLLIKITSGKPRQQLIKKPISRNKGRNI